MSESLESAVRDICRSVGNDRTRMMDVVEAAQARFGCVSSPAMDLIARELSVHRIDVEGVVSFYAFLSKQPKGKLVIRLSTCVADQMAGAEAVGKVFEKELGIGFGQTTADGLFTLERTSCIGMCDQAPAALVNDVAVTRLTPEGVPSLVRTLRERKDARSLVAKRGDGQNASDRVAAMVSNNIQHPGAVVLAEFLPGSGLTPALAKTPDEVIAAMKWSRLRGRGGAGFSTGMKWEFAARAPAKPRVVICNADEGEPGTFKDRVILTERPHLVFEGMTVAAWAIGAEIGLIYLRGEYRYLKEHLEAVLAERRAQNQLGKDIGGKKGFNFDIRVVMGAGAYVCGEETALISSAEGRRGEPKTRPPFPAQSGYLGHPTIVNNVETYCAAARIMEKGPDWFVKLGEPNSPGTKLLSISGDVSRPGVYEVAMGTTVREVLREAGGLEAAAVMVGGPSGQTIGPDKFDRKIAYDHLATGGAFMVFGKGRDLLKIASEWMEFFVEESCGFCTPCRVGNTLLKARLDKIRAGKGTEADLAYLIELGTTVKATSRCGLGQTSPNPIMTTIENFRPLYEAKLQKSNGLQLDFDIAEATRDAVSIQGPGLVHSED